MKAKFQVGLMAIFLSIFISCGSSAQPVRYVYVNNPEYVPSSTTSQGYGQTIDNSSIIPPAGQSASVSSSNNVVNSNTVGQVVTNSAQPQRCQELADEYVPGYYRGFGMGKSKNMNAARTKARLVATAAAAKKVDDIIEESSEYYTNENGSLSSESFWLRIKSKVKEYRITNPIVVCSSTSERQGNYEVSMCVQVTAEDVLMYLSSEIDQLSKSDQERFNNTIINQVPK